MLWVAMLSLNDRTKTKVSGTLANYFSDLFTKKRKLVKLELDFTAQVKADWETILGNTVTDRVKAQKSLKACYLAAGLEVPSIRWVDHPVNAIQALINQPDLRDVSGIITNQIWHQSEIAIQTEIDPASTAFVLAQVSPHHTVRTLTGKHQISSIADRLNGLVMTKISDLYWDLTESTIPNPLQDYRISDLSYFDYFMRIGVNTPEIQLAIDLAESCGWVWTFEKVAILTPKPTKVRIDRHGNVVAIIYNGVNILSEV